ncbi:MAG: hypothetical protein K2P57_11430 [Burkholderiales bacterium]|nr:hypothetical protein [Burkholderiales bacterium]
MQSGSLPLQAEGACRRNFRSRSDGDHHQAAKLDDQSLLELDDIAMQVASHSIEIVFCRKID